MFNQELEEKMRSARRAFDAATSEDIVAYGSSTSSCHTLSN